MVNALSVHISEPQLLGCVQREAQPYKESDVFFCVGFSFGFLVGEWLGDNSGKKQVIVVNVHCLFHLSAVTGETRLDLLCKVLRLRF